MLFENGETRIPVRVLGTTGFSLCLWQGSPTISDEANAGSRYVLPQPRLGPVPWSLEFPQLGLTITALCRICEPIAFMSIFPYIYFMIEDFHITQDKNKISFYAGMVTSAFTFAEFSTGVLWGRLSDKVGRKPVLLTGLAGTALSVLIFGFAPNLVVALVARALGGLLNGLVDIKP